jgi:hypothetical protein
MIIFFVPAYDDSTTSNLSIAKRILLPNFINLFDESATRANLLREITRSEYPIFVMSHGTADKLIDHNKADALTVMDIQVLANLKIYAFACSTAVKLGKVAASSKAIWWGYSSRVACYVDSPIADKFFIDIFSFIRDTFHQGSTDAEISDILKKLKILCEKAQHDLNLIFEQHPDTENMLGIVRTIIDIWTKLQVWIYGLPQPIPIMHPTAPPPILDGWD